MVDKLVGGILLVRPRPKARLRLQRALTFGFWLKARAEEQSAYRPLPHRVGAHLPWSDLVRRCDAITPEPSSAVTVASAAANNAMTSPA